MFSNFIVGSDQLIFGHLRCLAVSPVTKPTDKPFKWIKCQKKKKTLVNPWTF